jgi:hypothetical protein
MCSVSCTFPAEPDSCDNKTIGREQAFYPPDTQIEIYPAVSSSGYDIVMCQADKGTAISEPLHQVTIYILSYFFVLVHIIALF